MLKIVHLDPYFPTGEITVQPVLLWANGRPCYEGITKHASVGSDYFKSITPIPGHSIVYVLAMGAWETYGENRNGDAFPEFAYKEYEKPPWITPQDVLPQHYQSFERYAFNYRHHQNKDPKKAVGKVMKAFWNGSMHRVELLIDLEDAKAPDLAERIANGEFPPVSMGCKVPYDVCVVCGNRAPTRSQYCNHAKFQMRDVINGLKVCVLNPSPRLFDISWVFKPADPTAFMLKKVAEAAYDISGSTAGEYLEDMNRQKTATNKLAVIDKIVQGIPVDAKTEGCDPIELQNLLNIRDLTLDAAKNTEELPDSLLRQASNFSLPQVFSSAMASGRIVLNTPEVVKVITYRSLPKIKEVPEDILSKSVILQRNIIDLFKEFPGLLDSLQKTGALSMGVDQVVPSLVQAFEPYMEKRSGIPQYLYRRFVPPDWRKEPPRTTLLTLTDPATGQAYATNRAAAIRAHDEIAKRNLYKVLGGAGLLAVGYKLLGHGLARRGLAKYKPLLGLGLGGLGLAHWPSMGPYYRTDQGIPIPAMTELAKVSSEKTATLAVPLLGTLGLMTGLSHDYLSRLQSGIPIRYPDLPLSRRLLDTIEEFSYNHPLVTGALGVMGSRALLKRPAVQAFSQKVVTPAVSKAKNILQQLARGEKISSYLEIPETQSTVLLPELDLDKTAEWIGWLIVEG